MAKGWPPWQYRRDGLLGRQCGIKPIEAFNASGLASTLGGEAPAFKDRTGQEETIDHYKIYRGEEPTFIPDKAGGSNLIGTSVTESFSDPFPMTNDNPYFYIVTAVDTAGNEANAKPAVISTLPDLSGYWTSSTIELSWTDAAPMAEVVGYRVYYGKAPGQYEHVDDVGFRPRLQLSR